MQEKVGPTQASLAYSNLEDQVGKGKGQKTTELWHGKLDSTAFTIRKI